MANPYLAKQTKAPAPWGGNVGAVMDARRRPAAAPTTAATPEQSKDWLSQYGPTMCEAFKKVGQGMGSDPSFTGDLTVAKANFESFYRAYEKPLDQAAIKDFAWDCFVQGFEAGRALNPGSSGNSGSGSGGSNDDGWGFGTWALVLGGLGAAGLFGYNYLYAKG